MRILSHVGGQLGHHQLQATFPARQLQAEAGHEPIAAQARVERAARFASGLHHLSAQGATSWHGFAARIVDLARGLPALGPVRAGTVTPIASADYPLPARRPLNSRLCSDRLMARFGLQLPGWERCLETVMAELAAHMR